MGGRWLLHDNAAYFFLGGMAKAPEGWSSEQGSRGEESLFHHEKFVTVLMHIS
jgi:hypothetical protein